MTHQGQNQERLARFTSLLTTSQIMDSSQHHMASTAEGCRISRDGQIGFVVVCGIGTKQQRRVPTMPAAYAVCQQLMPRKLATLSRTSSL